MRLLFVKTFMKLVYVGVEAPVCFLMGFDAQNYDKCADHWQHRAAIGELAGRGIGAR